MSPVIECVQVWNELEVVFLNWCAKCRVKSAATVRLETSTAKLSGLRSVLDVATTGWSPVWKVTNVCVDGETVDALAAFLSWRDSALWPHRYEKHVKIILITWFFRSVALFEYSLFLCSYFVYFDNIHRFYVALFGFQFKFT